MSKLVIILMVTMVPMSFVAIRVVAKSMHQNVLVPTVALAIAEVALVIAIFVVFNTSKSP